MSVNKRNNEAIWDIDDEEEWYDWMKEKRKEMNNIEVNWIVKFKEQLRNKGELVHINLERKFDYRDRIGNRSEEYLKARNLNETE